MITSHWVHEKDTSGLYSATISHVESFPNGGGVRQIVIFKRDHRSKLDTKHISKRKANNLSFIRISSV